MKLKSIITIALATVFMVGVTSCEDMLKVDSKTLMLEKDVRWDSPVDTVYPVLGVIKKMQQIADRTMMIFRTFTVMISNPSSQVTSMIILLITMLS